MAGKQVMKIGEPTIGEYKGNETLSIPVNKDDEGMGYPFTFGRAKANAILEYIDDIREFAKNS